MRVLAAAGPRLTPPSARCIFIVGQPKTLALQYATGKPCVSKQSGKPQRMYTFTNGERAWFDLPVADAIDSLTLAVGQPFTLCHHGGEVWDVDRAPQALPPQASTARAPAPQPPRYWGQEAAPEAPHLRPERKHAPGAPTDGDHSNSPGNILASFYPDAIEVLLAGVAAAKERGLMLAPTFEDLRCVAATLYITHTGGRS
jgi:hypothetical protein